MTEEYILLALRIAQGAPKKIDAFIKSLMDETHIVREAAILIWLRVLHILKKKKRFISLEDPAEKQHALDVASHHPDPKIPFVLSHHAT